MVVSKEERLDLIIDLLWDQLSERMHEEMSQWRKDDPEVGSDRRAAARAIMSDFSSGPWPALRQSWHNGVFWQPTSRTPSQRIEKLCNRSQQLIVDAREDWDEGNFEAARRKLMVEWPKLWSASRKAIKAAPRFEVERLYDVLDIIDQVARPDRQRAIRRPAELTKRGRRV